MNHRRSKYRAGLIGVIVAMAALAGSTGCAHHPPAQVKLPGVDHYVAGALAYQNGQTNEALDDLSQAVKENPDLPLAHVIMGDIYRSRSDYRDAETHYESAVKLDPYDFKNHYDLGVAYQFLNRLQDAAASYLKALKLNPEDVNTTMNLGLVYLGLNHPDDALEMMQRAVRLDPNLAAAHCNLGVVLDARGNYPAGELEYRRAIELDDNSGIAFMDLAGNLINQNRGEEAVLVMHEVLKRSDTTQARKRYGDALVLAGRDDDAYRQYAEAVHRDPNYWQALNQAGMILIRKYQAGLTLDENLRRQAIAIWQKSLEIRPDQPQIQVLVDKWNQNGKVLP
jgi:tetratricopeptide (TPR) repeat protein